MRPKLKDVAARAGVSESTVSRVLNGRTGVAGRTRVTVLEAISDLGFHDVAVPSRDGAVGIITPELDNPIFPLIAQSIEARLARHGLLAMICASTPDTVAEQDYLDHFSRADAAGVIIINGRYTHGPADYTPYEELIERGMPIVLVNGVPKRCPVPAVGVDFRAAGEMAVHHLATLGHERIGCLAGPRSFVSTQQLIEGYRAGLRAVGLAYDAKLISESYFTVEGGHAGTDDLLGFGATGVITTGDLMALGAIAGVRAEGLDVPGDISVVGFDGTRLVTLTDPPLTTIRQPVERMAGAVVTLLTRHREGTQIKLTQLFRPELLIGRSTAMPPR